jgi:hypothetical protein
MVFQGSNSWRHVVKVNLQMHEVYLKAWKLRRLKKRCNG